MTEKSMEAIGANIAVVVVVLITFYLAIIRPNQTQQKKRREMLDSLRVGDRVVTVGGLYGDIVKLTAETAMLKIADGVEIMIIRSAVKYLVDGEELKKERKNDLKRR